MGAVGGIGAAGRVHPWPEPLAAPASARRREPAPRGRCRARRSDAGPARHPGDLDADQGLRRTAAPAPLAHEAWEDRRGAAGGVRLATVQPVQRRAARLDHRSCVGAVAVEQPGTRGRPTGVRVPLDGWAGRAVVHREVRGRGGDPQAGHPRHPLPGFGEGRRAACQQGPQGHRAAVGRPHQVRPKPPVAAPAAARLRVHRPRQVAAPPRRDHSARAEHRDGRGRHELSTPTSPRPRRPARQA